MMVQSWVRVFGLGFRVKGIDRVLGFTVGGFGFSVWVFRLWVFGLSGYGFCWAFTMV